MFKPAKVNILGKEYLIEYCDNPANVDSQKREALWGSIDHWTRTIRVYDNGRVDGDILATILHEIIHAIATELNIKALRDNEDDVELLAIAIGDTFSRNGWLKDIK